MANDIVKQTAKPKVAADPQIDVTDGLQAALGPTVVKLIKPLASLRLTVALLANGFSVSTCFPAAIAARFHGPCQALGSGL